MTLRDDLMRILSDYETFTAGDGRLSIRARGPRTLQELADEILALKGFYTEYGWCNDWDPVEPSGSTYPDEAELKRGRELGYHLVTRQRYEDAWTEVKE